MDLSCNRAIKPSVVHEAYYLSTITILNQATSRGVTRVSKGKIICIKLMPPGKRDRPTHTWQTIMVANGNILSLLGACNNGLVYFNLILLNEKIDQLKYNAIIPLLQNNKNEWDRTKNMYFFLSDFYYSIFF